MSDYPIRKLSEVPDCDHKGAQFWGMYSLIGYYHCDKCQSKFCPQEYQNWKDGKIDNAN